MQRTVTTVQGDMLDLVCFRFYGRHRGTVEAVLDANPGLAARPFLLPAGVVIVMPGLPAPAEPATVRLWD